MPDHPNPTTPRRRQGQNPSSAPRWTLSRKNRRCILGQVRQVFSCKFRELLLGKCWISSRFSGGAHQNKLVAENYSSGLDQKEETPAVGPGSSLLRPALRRKPAAFFVIATCYRKIVLTAEWPGTFRQRRFSAAPAVRKRAPAAAGQRRSGRGRSSVDTPHNHIRPHCPDHDRIGRWLAAA
jgi:hypothetical protein